MKYLLVLVLVICSSAVDAKEYWHPNNSGCFSQTLSDTLFAWEAAPELSAGGIRIAVQPDTGNGPTRLVVIDPGHGEIFGSPAVDPFLLVAVGTGRRTCVHKEPIHECPAALSVLQSLHRQSIPVGFQADSPALLPVIHGETYYLDFRDGQGNLNQWRFYGAYHPMQAVIEVSFEQLKECISPVQASLDGR
ncbi:hypothetical protein [Cognatiluteimonas profundi]|uniref:hypothetical protein n=1 Tax=Cognatiluteimonas profundi TaxID=2594501 RepID=UPI00131CE267|nr:hypothetical protein [Lysobacter profundi]